MLLPSVNQTEKRRSVISYVREVDLSNYLAIVTCIIKARCQAKAVDTICECARQTLGSYTNTACRKTIGQHIRFIENQRAIYIHPLQDSIVLEAQS